MLDKRYVSILLICTFSLIFNAIYITKLKNEEEKNWRLEKTIEAQKIKIERYEFKINFLDDEVVIIPDNTDYYMSYDNWEETKYYNQNFSILKTEIAIEKGYKYYSKFIDSLIEKK